MHCSRCGAQLGPNTAFCGACGASVGVTSGVVSPLKRPGTITLLAVLQFIGAAFSLLIGLGMIATAATGDPSVPFAAIVGAVFAIAAVLEIVCGVGLLKLKSYGRTIQLVFAWIGLIGFPIGTLISILILVYLMKPGIKLLFSGRPATSMSAEELNQVAAASQGSGVVIALAVVVVGLVGVAMIGIIAAIAIPGLLRARMAGNEAAAVGSLRSIVSGEAAFASACGGGGYAVALEDLVKPPRNSTNGFISPDLAVNGVIKSGYRVTLVRDAAEGVEDVGTAADTCNGAARAPASSFFASAEPVNPGNTGSQYFAVDASGTIYSSPTPIRNPIAASPEAVPIQ